MTARSRCGSRSFVLGSLVLILGSVSSPATAHVGKQAKSIRLRMSSQKLVVEVTWDVNPGDDAKVVRATYDRNQDGRLDEAELGVLRAFLGRNATSGLVLSLGGSEVRPKLLAQTFFGLDLAAGAPEPLGIRASFELEHGGAEIRLEDRSVPPKLDLDVPVVVDVEPGVIVAFANMGELSVKDRQVRRVKINNSAAFIVRARPSAGTSAGGPRPTAFRGACSSDRRAPRTRTSSRRTSPRAWDPLARS